MMRAKDWSASPLGHHDRWPSPLLHALSIMLASNQPMFVTWGPEQTLFYNDSYIALLQDRHPAALGAPMLDVWHEIRSDLAPLVARTLAGEAHYADNIELALFRGGVRQNTYFAYSYTPLRDEAGLVQGIFCACLEITSRVRADRRAAFLSQLIEDLRPVSRAADAIGLAAARLGQYLGAARCGYGEMDKQARIFTVVREWSREAAGGRRASFTLDDFGSALGAELRAGRPVLVRDAAGDARTQPGLSAYEAAGNIRSLIAVPLILHGSFTAFFYVHAPAPLPWDEGDVALVEAVADQVWHAVERSRAAAALRDNEERLRLATEAAEIGLWDVDPARDEIHWTPPVYAIFGIAGGTPVTLQDFYAGLHPDDLERVTSAFAAALDPARRLVYDVEYRVIRREDGAERWVAAKGRGLFDSQGRCVRCIGTAIDITARRRAAQRLRESEAALGEAMSTLDALLVNAPVGLAFLDANHCYVRLNETLAAINGRPVAEHIGRHIADIIPDKAALIAPVLDEVFRTGKAAPAIEVAGGVAETPDEPRFWLANIFPVRDSTGSVRYAGATLIDITARKRAEASVRQLNETLEARVAARTAERDRLWRNTQDMQMVLSRDGVLLAVNPAMLRVLGWPEEAMLGRNALEFVHPEDRPASVLALSRAGRERLPVFENRFRGSDGRHRWVAWVAAPEEGVVYASGRDIDAERASEAALARAEEALRQAQKMEAVGQLTGGIAHDFNNLLQGVTGSLDLIRRRPDDPARVRRLAEAGLHAAERGAKLTAQLLTFSRVHKPELKPVPVARIFGNMRELLPRTIGPTVDISIEEPHAGLAVLADEVQIEMALLNLAINARDAMNDGGKLVITAQSVTGEGHVGLALGDYVEITVRDWGAGMPPDVAARAFDPFFTTKGVGKGTGLGLSQVYGAARQAGGGSFIESAPGQGTIVRLLLRAAPPVPDEAAPAPAAAQAAQSGAGQVLVVDDDPDVRAFLVATLDTLGYSSVTAADGASGLALLGCAAPDILVVDFAMPGMNGAEMAPQARKLHPGLPVIFATGFADSAALSDAAAPGTTILRKPFHVDDLAAALTIARRAG